MGKSSDLDMENFDVEIDPFAESPETADPAGGGADPFDFAPPTTAAPAPKAPKGKAGAPPPAEAKAPPSRPAAQASAKVDPRAAGMTADVPLQLVAVMGKKTMTIKEILSLAKGQILELNRFPNEAIDLVANGKLMAKGELVEIDGKLGVRIIRIFE
jgi:type III secretion system YscQ/HrcQ family protein